MAGLRQTTAKLAGRRRQWQESLSPAPSRSGASSRLPVSKLQEVEDFGGNPGNLRMLVYKPDELPAGAPLVVALHGCTQTAEAFDAGAGWSALADRFGFALLLPEQRTSNNANGCFNWFLPGDARRGRGEAGSIREMIERVVADHDLDRTRVFVAGFSAGGAMTSALLATYPEIFAGGAIIAGLPFGGATNVRQALDGMMQGKSRAAREWAYFVRRASSHKGPWPRLSVWHGSADSTVQPMNAGEIIKQWTEVHGLTLYPTEAAGTRGHQRRVWRARDGAILLESHSISGMGHAVPVARGDTQRSNGAEGPFTVDVGISASYEIASFWDLTEPPQTVVTSNSQITPAGANVRRTLPFGS